MMSISIEEVYSIALALVLPSIASLLHRSLRFVAVGQHAAAAAQPWESDAQACSCRGRTSLCAHIVKCIFIKFPT